MLILISISSSERFLLLNLPILVNIKSIKDLPSCILLLVLLKVAKTNENKAENNL